ncbi:MAG: radical SAM protein [Bacteroidales bacterium]|jgi:uncharacterized protein|nr:radical SAM protein [Bacteroidales bacterium]
MYKQSCYNYFINDTAQVIYLNGISGVSFSVKEDENKKLQLLLHDLTYFKGNYPLFFNKLIEWGFVIDENRNEIDTLKAKHRIAAIENRDYHLIINPTQECNFNCWYCYETHPTGHMTEKTVAVVKKHIKQMIEVRRITSLNIGWFGGEPLLYFDEVVYPISLYAKELCAANHLPFGCGVTSNASKINPRMIKKMNEIALSNFQITLDGGEKRHNRIRNEKGKPSFDIIVRNIYHLCEQIENIRINLRINYDDKTLEDESLESVFNQIPSEYRKFITVDFQRVWQTLKRSNAGNNNDCKDTLQPVENQKKLELHEMCHELGYRCTLPSAVFNIGLTHKCYADRYHYAHINYDGKVYSCTARDYTDNQVFGELVDDGQIVWKQDKIIGKIAKAPFENEMCLSCKYLPLCMGPCSQAVMDAAPHNLQRICYLNREEIKPETVIIDYFKKKEKLAAQRND